MPDSRSSDPDILAGQAAIERGYWSSSDASRCFREAQARGATLLDTAQLLGLLSSTQVAALDSGLHERPRLPEVGERVAGLTIEAQLGAGGMGAVFAARRGSGERLALKVLTELTPDARERFEREARAAAAAGDHPGIVRVQELREDRGRLLLLMDLVDGESLAERLERGPLPPDEAWELGAAVAEALAHSHALGIIHRDLKPSNILLPASGAGPQLTDFGVSRLLGADSLTASQEALGTPTYMAPEQFDSSKDAGPACDVYALGAVLYECLTGRPPFRASSLVELMARVASEPPEDPRRACPALSAPRARVLLRALAKRPQDRYETAAAFGAALDGADAPARRRRGGLVLGALALALALCGAGALLSARAQARAQAQSERDATLREAAEAALAALPEALAARRLPPAFAAAAPREPFEALDASLASARRLDGAGLASYDPGLLDEAQAALDARRSLRPTPPAAPQLRGWGALLETRAALEAYDFGERLEGLTALADLGARGAFSAPLTSALCARLLDDRLAWSRATELAQDRAIADVGRALGPGWRLVQAARYECGGAAHRIATFELRRAGLRLNLIPGGRFTLGSEPNEPGRYEYEGPTRELEVPPLLVGVTEVTHAQWLGAGGEPPRTSEAPDMPVSHASFDNAQAWVRALGEGLRLPSEVEWEYACRAGTQSPWCFGADEAQLPDYAWYNDNSEGDAHPVQRKAPNAFGLYDVHGNVAEYCLDELILNYDTGPRDARPRNTGGKSKRRVERGGAMAFPGRATRSAFRLLDPSIVGFGYQGLRLVRELPSRNP